MEMNEPLKKEERLARLALYLALNLNGGQFHHILRIMGSAEAALEGQNMAALSSYNLAPLLRGGHFEEACEALELAEKEGLDILVLGDDNYPTRLSETHEPPPVLWIKGRLMASDKFSVALVGSRKASVSGLRTSRTLAREASVAGLCVVSGLAKGIDAAAHLGALEAGGRTLAVLGCGLDHVYPAENRRLYEMIPGENGALISEFPPHVRPQPQNFPRRNRIIAGLSLAVVLIEAPERSGSLITARLALELGREVMALPGPPGSFNNQGSHKLIKNGAALVENMAEVIREIKPRLLEGLQKRPEPTNLEPLFAPLENNKKEENAPIKKNKAPVEKQSQPDKLFLGHLTAEEMLLLELLKNAPASVDELIRFSNLSSPEISEILLNLELEGIVGKNNQGQYFVSLK